MQYFTLNVNVNSGLTTTYTKILICIERYQSANINLRNNLEEIHKKCIHRCSCQWGLNQCIPIGCQISNQNNSELCKVIDKDALVSCIPMALLSKSCYQSVKLGYETPQANFVWSSFRLVSKCRVVKIIQIWKPQVSKCNQWRSNYSLEQTFSVYSITVSSPTGRNKMPSTAAET